MRMAIILSLGLFACASVRAQFEQLAASGDGGVLLLRSGFRLRTETDLGPQGKIYRWENGNWTRLAAIRDSGFQLSPSDVFGPFVSTNGKVEGWQTYAGCGLCQIIVAPPLSSQVSGVSLPPGFPRGTIRMSRNGRYFTADSYPFSGPKHLDDVTGQITDLPSDLFVRPVVRDVTNDGTVLLLLTQPEDRGEINSPAALALWKPGSAAKPVYTETRVKNPAISANGARIAFESVIEGGPDDDRRTLLVLDPATAEQIAIAAMPPRDFRAFTESFAKPVWDANGTRLLYRKFDDRERPVEIAVWDWATRESRTVLTAGEGFISAVISDDGQIVWAATRSNRLLRMNLGTGESEEILPPLGSITRPESNAVPGSAILVRGAAFSMTDTVADGDVTLPVVDSVEEGLWVQVPWEYAALPQGRRRIVIRRDNHPFEAVTDLSLTHNIEPHIATFEDSVTGMAYAKAVHADFRSLVTPSNPARPGETVHVYLTGLGPLDTTVPTGTPAPFAPLARPLTVPVFRLGSTILNVPFLGYAAGMVGIYQADVTIPAGAPDGVSPLYCTVTDSAGTRSGVALLATTSKPD